MFVEPSFQGLIVCSYDLCAMSHMWCSSSLRVFTVVILELWPLGVRALLFVLSNVFSVIKYFNMCILYEMGGQ